MKTKFIKRIAAAGMAVACMVATTISAFALEGRSNWNENGYESIYRLSYGLCRG